MARHKISSSSEGRRVVVSQDNYDGGTTNDPDENLSTVKPGSGSNSMHTPGQGLTMKGPGGR